MRIVCPDCNAVYEVPQTMLGAEPRRVRCARCGHEWTPAPVEPLAAPIIAPVPEPAMPSMRPALAESPPLFFTPESRTGSPTRPEGAPARGGAAAVAALVISVLVLCGLGAAAYVWRAEVMAYWPPSQRVYDWLKIR